MGPIQQGRWEGVAPVAGTFLVFLRNFSEGLRNAGACESKCPADRDAFVLQRGALSIGSDMLINAIFSGREIKPRTDDQ